MLQIVLSEKKSLKPSPKQEFVRNFKLLWRSENTKSEIDALIDKKTCNVYFINLEKIILYLREKPCREFELKMTHFLFWQNNLFPSLGNNNNTR